MSVCYRVHYQIADYRGSIEVTADEDDDQEHIIAVAKKKLFRIGGPPTPMYHESYRVERLS